MPRHTYIKRDFKAATLGIIAHANRIITDYTARGFKLTLRQLYYKFISDDLFGDDWIDEEYNLKQGLDPRTKNTLKNYKRLGGIINDARLGGKVDWEAIEDRTRETIRPVNWENPQEIIRAVSKQFQIDKWDNQEWRPEIWVEKEALAGVFEPIATRHNINVLCCRGYTSQSEMWGSAQRLIQVGRTGQKPVIFHFGDHDPSGMDMSRDIEDRLRLFGAEFAFERVALNINQVRQYRLPPNPAKQTDIRFKKYEEDHGTKSWELDALDPQILSDLADDAIAGYRDDAQWAKLLKEEQRMKADLVTISANWSAVVKQFCRGKTK